MALMTAWPGRRIAVPALGPWAGHDSLVLNRAPGRDVCRAAVTGVLARGRRAGRKRPQRLGRAFTLLIGSSPYTRSAAARPGIA